MESTSLYRKMNLQTFHQSIWLTLFTHQVQQVRLKARFYLMQTLPVYLLQPMTFLNLMSKMFGVYFIPLHLTFQYGKYGVHYCMGQGLSFFPMRRAAILAL